MQLTRSNLSSYLHAYTDFEQIYKKRYTLLASAALLNQYIASIPYAYIEKNLLLIPEKLIHRFRSENGTIYQNEPLSLMTSQPDVLLEKHPRYMSEFWHNHAYFEILYVYDGSCTNRFGDTTFTMQTGDLCIIAPRITHSIGVFDDSIVLNIQIKPQVFFESFAYLLHTDKLLSSFFLHALTEKIYNPYLIFRMPENIAIRTPIENALLEYFNQQAYANDFVISYIRLFFSACLRAEKKEVFLADMTKNNLKKMEAILDYIKRNYQTITLDELAATFHYSRPYMSKLIKEYTGRTFMQLLQGLRLEQAALLLTRTGNNIPDIAYACGYESPEHFIRIFHQRYQLSPLQYRKKNRS